MAERDQRTGRYAHTWGWQGFDAQGQEWSNCDYCGKWRGPKGARPPTRTWGSPDPDKRTDYHLVFGVPVAT